MLDPIVLAALVYLIKVVLQTYFPQFPVSDELIYAILTLILSWLGLEVVKVAVAKYAPKYRAYFKL